ncbi:MAG: HAD family hydrolase [Bacteroidales bacterium]|nr:HAD family hydrolase [Bacteroidales bacterium]
MIRNILFDFDGVLAESVNVKTQAFRKLYEPFGEEIANKVVEHHLKNGGVSRFEKFKIYHSWVGYCISEKEVKDLSDKFSEMVLKGVINAPEVKGTYEFLNNYYLKYNLWIISGTPTEEMKAIVKERGLEKYFKEIYGSPKKKYEWTEYVINKNSLIRSETVLIGDAKSDHEASLHSDLHYILRETAENIDLFKNYKGLRIKDLTNLLEILKSL